jgi:hypothetical protein
MDTFSGKRKLRYLSTGMKMCGVGDPGKKSMNRKRDLSSCQKMAVRWDAPGRRNNDKLRFRSCMAPGKRGQPRKII